MMIVRSLEEIPSKLPSAVTVGSFDGVHLGHRAILMEAVARGRAITGRSVAVTFDPHPREVVGRGPVAHLTSIEERIGELELVGIDLIVVLNFTYAFSRQSPREFYRSTLADGIGAVEVIEGYDHMFGRDREGGVGQLLELGKEFGVGTTTVPPVLVDGEPVSSTRIRSLLADGNVGLASRMLGRPYRLAGTVVRGDGRGRELGFPTANVVPADARKVIPSRGVYAVTVRDEDRTYGGMMNIGTRPTFTDGRLETIEVHLFDFEGDLVGRPVALLFHRRLRGEQKFSSKEEFLSQLRLDESACREFFASKHQEPTP